ncbi:MAG: hypothetical protein M3O30_16535 [Planctomycetota bacterium]|nr:hypothetical protein [Planctomycetota bacterium]
MRTQKLLAAILVLQVVNLLNQWVGAPISRAQAQVPDAGAQRLQMIDEIRASNEKLDKMISILDSGKLQVVVAKPDETEKK